MSGKVNWGEVPKVVKTVTIEPHWPGLRAYAVRMYLCGEHTAANDLQRALGCEGVREWPPTVDTDPEVNQPTNEEA